MLILDLIDKRIIFELLGNYRVSYQALATKFDLSVNAVKKRIEKLESVGIIRGGSLIPLPAMSGAEDWVAILAIKEPSTSKELLDKIGAHPFVHAGSVLTDGSILCFGFYRGAKDLQEIGTFLRQFPSVEAVEFHTILSEPGKQYELTNSDLRVLRCLRQTPRMPVKKIAQLTGLPPRRVKKIIEKLIGENGSEYVNHLNWEPQGRAHPNEVGFQFTVLWDLNAGGHTAFIIKIRHAEGVETRTRIVDILKTTYPFEFWYSYASAFEPVFFAIFVVEHIRQSQEIAHMLRQVPEVVDIYPIFGYPTKVFRSQVDDYFERIFKKLEPS
ncbi:MAG: winged helix-turn-helix transcriptional regulator [Candidatus Thorarchaeota archaeon]